MIILLDMTQNWNDDWVSKEDDRCASHCCSCVLFSWKPLLCPRFQADAKPRFIACRFLYALLAVTVAALVGAIALIGVSFYWFNPAGVGDCSFNVFVMTMTIMLTLGVSLGSLHPQVQLLVHHC